MTMISKERAVAAIKREPVDRVPVVAICYGTHEFMKKTGAFWPDAHYDARKMVELAKATAYGTGLESIMVPFTLTCEAEALGVPIKRGSEVIPPSVRHSTYNDPSEVPYEDMLDKTPVPEVIRAVEILKEETPDLLLFPKITGTVTLAAHLRGVDRLVKDTLLAPETLKQWLDVAGKAARLFCTAVAEAGADVIMISDPTSSPETIMPEFYRDFAMPVNRETIRTIHSKGALAMLHTCGNVNPILEYMAQTEADMLSIEEKVDMAEAKKRVGDKVALMGNVAPLHVLQATPEEVYNEAMDVLRKGVDLLAPGCGIPPLSPTENIRALRRAAEDFAKGS
ncbi:MAG: MtaA/CmuA family methyltransferase [Methermicoccaceae archaeon]